MRIIPIADLREKLQASGCTGLYYPGECACTIDDLAPCGQQEQEDGDDWINGCEPGFKHDDPRPGHAGDWMVSRTPEPPTLEQWERMDGIC